MKKRKANEVGGQKEPASTTATTWELSKKAHLGKKGSFKTKVKTRPKEPRSAHGEGAQRRKVLNEKRGGVENGTHSQIEEEQERKSQGR